MQYLWLDSDFYLSNSETPPSSRQTILVEQIKAPSIYKIYFNYLETFFYNFNLLKTLLLPQHIHLYTQDQHKFLCVNLFQKLLT